MFLSFVDILCDNVILKTINRIFLLKDNLSYKKERMILFIKMICHTISTPLSPTLPRDQGTVQKTRWMETQRRV